MTGLNHRFDENVYDRNANFHPGSVFDHPRDVLADAALSQAEKRAILAMRHPGLPEVGHQDQLDLDPVPLYRPTLAPREKIK